MDKQTELASPKLEAIIKERITNVSLQKYLPKITFPDSTDFYKKHTFYKKSEG